VRGLEQEQHRSTSRAAERPAPSEPCRAREDARNAARSVTRSSGQFSTSSTSTRPSGDDIASDPRRPDAAHRATALGTPDVNGSGGRHHVRLPESPGRGQQTCGVALDARADLEQRRRRRHWRRPGAGHSARPSTSGGGGPDGSSYRPGRAYRRRAISAAIHSAQRQHTYTPGVTPSSWTPVRGRSRPQQLQVTDGPLGDDRRPGSLTAGPRAAARPTAPRQTPRRCRRPGRTARPGRPGRRTGQARR